VRFCLEFELEHNEIPLDYRSCLLSFFKSAFLNYSKDIYEELYHKDNPIIKPFTFSVYLGKADFGYKTISLNQKKIKLNFSTSNPEYGINFYNAMLKMRLVLYPFGSNNIRMQNFKLVKEKIITQNQVLVKTMSPVIVRKHDREKNFDTYYGFNSEGYLEVLKENIFNSAKNFFDFDVKADIEQLEIIPIEMSETMVLYHGHKIKGNLGKFAIFGKTYLLDYLLKSGIGARRSQGFGMVDVEGEVRM